MHPVSGNHIESSIGAGRAADIVGPEGLGSESALLSMTAANFLSVTADRFFVLQILSLLVVWGPLGENLGLGCALLLAPMIAGSLVAGIVTDKWNRLAILRATLLFRGLLSISAMVALPFVIESDGRIVFSALFLVFVLLFSQTFTLARLSLTADQVKAVHQPGQKSLRRILASVNGLNWSSGALATFLSLSLAFPLMASGLSLNSSPPLTSIGLRLAAVLYVIAFFVVYLSTRHFSMKLSFPPPITSGTTRGEARKSERIFADLSGYLDRHRGARRFFCLSIGLGTLSCLFYLSLTTLGFQSHRLSPVVVTELIPALCFGIVFGAGLAPVCIARLRTFETLALAAAATAIFSIILAAAPALSTAQFALFSLGAVTAVTLTMLETTLQTVFPSRRLGTIFALRESAILILLAGLVVYVDRILPAISLLPMLRVLALATIGLAAALFIGWQDMIFLIARTTARFILTVFFNYRVVDLSRTTIEPDAMSARSRPVILAGNHTGWLDGLIVGAALRQRVRFLVMAEAFNWPLIGFLIKRLGGIPVTKRGGREALARAAASLKRGESVLIFPEGRLSGDGTVGEFHKGVAWLHRQSGCPVVPFAIEGGFDVWPKNRRLPRFGKLSLKIGEPVSLTDLDAEGMVTDLRERVIALKQSLAAKAG